MGQRQLPGEDLVSVEDVARMLRVSVDWVYDRAASGDLPSYRLGRHLRFMPSEVWAVVRTWRQGAPSPLEGST